MDETRRIAQEYLGDQDIGRARSQLDALGVANYNQWLIFVVETDIAANADSAVVDALVQLVNDMGLRSTSVAQYLAANGQQAVAAAVAPTAVNVASEQVTQESPAVAQSEPTAQAEEEAEPSAQDTDMPTPTAEAEPAATETPLPAVPQAVTTNFINVRAGPGTTYNIIAGLQQGATVDVVGKNPQGDWWQVNLADGQVGWVFGALVETSNVESVAVAADIPAPPPVAVAPADTPTPAPVAAEPTTEPEPEPVAASPSDAPHFTLVEKRLWSKDENGGCQGQHLLRIHVFDANNVRLNGVPVQLVYTNQIVVTGSQGKGDGIIEHDIHGKGGEDVLILKDVDGREATSDRSVGSTIVSGDIPEDVLRNAGYCTSDEDCEWFINQTPGCYGHHSWDVKFQRNY